MLVLESSYYAMLHYARMCLKEKETGFICRRYNDCTSTKDEAP